MFALINLILIKHLTAEYQTETNALENKQCRKRYDSRFLICYSHYDEPYYRSAAYAKKEFSIVYSKNR